METNRSASDRLKSLARVIEKECLTSDSDSSAIEFLGKIAAILLALGTLSLIALFGILFIFGRGSRRYSYRHDDLLSSMTGTQFLLLWGGVMIAALILGFLAYRRHKSSGIMVDEWSETKGKNPFEPFAVMIFQTLDTFFAGKSQQESERAAMFAALLLKCTVENGCVPLVTTCQISPDTQATIGKNLRILPPPLEQEEILKALYKADILVREPSPTSTSETVIPGEAGRKLATRFGFQSPS